jgi:hypothetical protein
MKISLLIILITISVACHSQGAEDRVLFIVDSIAVVDDPKPEDGEMTESDVETITVINWARRMPRCSR